MKPLALLCLPALLFAQNIRVDTYADRGAAFGAACAYAATCKGVVGTGTGLSMAPILPMDGHRWNVAEPVSFDQVREGDCVVFDRKPGAADLARGVRACRVVHPCTGRTADRIYTCGMTSIANPNPTAADDGPTTQANYVGVVRRVFHWRTP